MNRIRLHPVAVLFLLVLCAQTGALAASNADGATSACEEAKTSSTEEPREPAQIVDPEGLETEEDRSSTPWALPAYVYVFETEDTDVGIFTPLLEVDSRLWQGHKYRVGTFLGSKLAGPGFTVSLFTGHFRGNPAEVSIGAFYLAPFSKVFDGDSQLSVGATFRALF